jgi:hypothetical protein
MTAWGVFIGGARDKHTKLLRIPGYDALNDLLAAIDLIVKTRPISTLSQTP